MKSHSEKPYTVGVLRKTKGSWLVEPLASGLGPEIKVTPGKKFNPGDIVAAQGTQLVDGDWVGRIQRVFHRDNLAQLTADVMLSAYQIPIEWPSSFANAKLPRKVDEIKAKDREDLRSVPFVTIDGPDARDFDDAVYADSSDGGWRLLVAIADVAHYVKNGSALDMEAMKRGNSVYLPDRVIPMLPEALSNGICSLKPFEDRLVVVCEMQIAHDGIVTSSRFCEALIRSHARLTYASVYAFIHGDESAVSLPANARASLKQLHNVYRSLRSRRDHRGALDFETNEIRVLLQNGEPKGVMPIERNDAHCLIEEAMIAANVCAARFLMDRGAISLYRVHDEPERTKYLDLRRTLALRGISMPEEIKEPGVLQAAINALSGSKTQLYVWKILILQSLMQARYDPRNVGHFGLALSEYTHFTSPIRRYSDLFIHRLIKRKLRKQRMTNGDLQEVVRLGDHLSETERRATVVSRKVDRWLICELLKERLGDEFWGTVGTVSEFGLFISLDRYEVAGLVHISRLGNDHFERIGMQMVGRRTGKSFSLGDRIKVVLVAVQPELGRVDLELFENMDTSRVSRLSKSRRYRRSRRSSRPRL